MTRQITISGNYPDFVESDTCTMNTQSGSRASNAASPGKGPEGSASSAQSDAFFSPALSLDFTCIALLHSFNHPANID